VVDVLVFLLILVLVLALLSWIVAMIPMPANVRNAVWIVIVVLAILIGLRRYGLL